MTAEEPRVSREGRYSVTQTCLALGISRNTLRKYTDEGYIKCGYR
jgi:predicted site-specific integrase-resolvase